MIALDRTRSKPTVDTIYLFGIAGVVLTTPGVAVTGLVLIGFGLSYFGLRQMLAR